MAGWRKKVRKFGSMKGFVPAVDGRGSSGNACSASLRSTQRKFKEGLMQRQQAKRTQAESLGLSLKKSPAVWRTSHRLLKLMMKRVRKNCKVRLKIGWTRNSGPGKP